jgi:hypothetical protein
MSTSFDSVSAPPEKPQSQLKPFVATETEKKN